MIEATAITKATERRIQLDDFCGVERKKVELQFLPTPDFYHFTIPSTHVVLVCSDGGQLAQELTENLISNGLRVVSLLLKKGSSAKHTYDISLADDQDLGRTIEQIRKDIGQIGGCIYLHPHMTFSGAQYDQHFTKEREWIKKAFLLAKHTKNDLVELGKETRSFFVTVSQMDGKLGYGDQYNMSVLGGGLSGLTKSLSLEWPTVFCRSIDMEPQMTVDVSSKKILSELHDPSRLISEVALHSSGRRTIVGIPTPIKGQDTIQSNIQSDDVFLVSGGAKGVTALCVIEMAKAFQSTFILLGRSDHSFALPDFAIDCDDDATLMKHIGNAIKEKGQKPSLQEIRSTLKKIQAKKEIDQTIKAVENHGSICKYIQVDVTNATEVKQSIANITSQTGPITGIIHGAGRLADKYIQDKTEKDFDNVLSVKLDGLQSMLKSINSQQLKHLILFSSVAGFYGNVGQTDYAIANEILSKIALLFKKNHPEVRIKALNWGAWDSGMVSGALKKKFE